MDDVIDTTFSKTSIVSLAHTIFTSKMLIIIKNKNGNR